MRWVYAERYPLGHLSRFAYAELIEDRHHRDLTESDYSNDTHDWGDTTYFNSDEYWNFLGRYE